MRWKNLPLCNTPKTLWSSIQTESICRHQVLYGSKTNFCFWKHSGKRKGENAGCQHFHLFPRCTVFEESFPNIELTLYHTILTFNDLEKEPFANIVEKGEHAQVTSIFSFSNYVFLSSQHKFQFFSHINFVICKRYQLSFCKKLKLGGSVV